MDDQIIRLDLLLSRIQLLEVETMTRQRLVGEARGRPKQPAARVSEKVL
jgi:hypothetical protein